MRSSALKDMGFNAKARERLAVFERLAKITNLQDTIDPDNAGGFDTCSKQLEELVLTGGNVGHITDARERIAKLFNIATDLRSEVIYLMNHEDEQIPGWDNTAAMRTRDELAKICRSLEGRAGEPEKLKSAKSEAMRCKLEVRLLPAMKKEIPRVAEQLRFLHSEVLKWRAPDEMLPAEIEDGKDPNAAEEVELKAWEAPTEDNLEPVDEEEEALLKAMGWNTGLDEDVDSDDETFTVLKAKKSEPEGPAAGGGGKKKIGGGTTTAGGKKKGAGGGKAKAIDSILNGDDWGTPAPPPRQREEEGGGMPLAGTEDMMAQVANFAKSPDAQDMLNSPAAAKAGLSEQELMLMQMYTGQKFQ
jgi:hypothetical protein